MLERIVSRKVFAIVERGLDAASLRQRVLSDNLANVDTPGYKRSDVRFQQELRRVMEARRLPLRLTHATHLSGKTVDLPAPQVVKDDTISYRNDGNNVDIDVEMARLAENSIYYDALARQMSYLLGSLRSAILEGRR